MATPPEIHNEKAVANSSSVPAYAVKKILMSLVGIFISRLFTLSDRLKDFPFLVLC